MGIFIADKTTKIIETCLVFDSMETALAMFPDKLCVERVAGNMGLQEGDVLPQ